MNTDLLDPAAERLLSSSSAVRLSAVRKLGKQGSCLCVLEKVAEADADVKVALTAAFWLAVHGRKPWLSHLETLSSSLTDLSARRLAADLHTAASQSLEES